MNNDCNSITYCVRSDSGLNVYLIDSFNLDTPLCVFSVSGNILDSCWSPDGIHLSVNAESSGVTLYKNLTWNDASIQVQSFSISSCKEVSTAHLQPLKHMYWSPLGTYFVCYWKHPQKKNFANTPVNDEGRNVFVWRMNDTYTMTKEFTLKYVTSFFLKGLIVGQWPFIKWRQDEMYCCVTSTSEVIIYYGSDVGGTPLLRIPVTGLITSEPAPHLLETSKKELTFASFHLSSGGASFYIFHISDVRQKTWSIQLNQKLDSVDSAKLQWNKSGSTLLIFTSNTVDKAGKSYGDVGDLYLVHRDGSGFVKLNRDNVQEACWHPTRNEVVYIEGKCPSDVMVCDNNGVVLHRIFKAYCNTLRWDSIGHILAIAGFGNLAGDIHFWYRNDQTLDLNSAHFVAQWREPCTVLCGWSPDNNYFFTASTFPRLKVDNYFKIFSKQGKLVYNKCLPKLYNFQWKPLTNYETRDVLTLSSGVDSIQKLIHQIKPIQENSETHTNNFCESLKEINVSSDHHSSYFEQFREPLKINESHDFVLNKPKSLRNDPLFLQHTICGKDSEYENNQAHSFSVPFTSQKKIYPEEKPQSSNYNDFKQTSMMCTTKCAESGDLLSLLKQVLPRDTPIHVASSSCTTSNTTHQKDFTTTPYSSTTHFKEMPKASYLNTHSHSVNLTLTEKPSNFLFSAHDNRSQLCTTPSKCKENSNNFFHYLSTKGTNQNNYKETVPNLLATLNDFCAEKNHESINQFPNSLPYSMYKNEDTLSNSFTKYSASVTGRNIDENIQNNNFLNHLRSTTSKKLSNTSNVLHIVSSNFNSQSYPLNEIFLSNSNLDKHAINSSIVHNDTKLFKANQMSTFDLPYKKCIDSDFRSQSSSYHVPVSLKSYSHNPSYAQSIEEFFANTFWEYIDPQGQIQGPFPFDLFINWINMDYFPPKLLIRCLPDKKFQPLSELFEFISASK
ncbi:uncharacterized protein LOC128884150 isoform X2 [Hylaeus volcanicus]|uniref:uncharacterized protein LOC128884150 isoform X2 n=1 Tax=Hylaeus volcanicus TaxID=313075 RepID=UPI0023B882C4|nr:uncharacterized protein LOC128884150 isoform X2 [Hylaeus volcanicus]